MLLDILKNIGQNKRVKSFLWRTGMMCLAVVIVEVINILPSLELAPGYTVLLGLILGVSRKHLGKRIKATTDKLRFQTKVPTTNGY
jgi:hypothetical protein